MNKPYKNDKVSADLYEISDILTHIRNGYSKMNNATSQQLTFCDSLLDMCARQLDSDINVDYIVKLEFIIDELYFISRELDRISDEVYNYEVDNDLIRLSITAKNNIDMIRDSLATKLQRIYNKQHKID